MAYAKKSLIIALNYKGVYTIRMVFYDFTGYLDPKDTQETTEFIKEQGHSGLPLHGKFLSIYLLTIQKRCLKPCTRIFSINQ